MNAKRRMLWANYAAHIGNRVGLRDWRFRVHPEPAAPGHGAEFHPYYGKREADIKLNAAWEQYSPERQREFITHELMHAHLHPADTLILNAIKPFMTRRESRLLYDEFTHLTEYAVDDIAKAFAQFLNLPGDVIPELAQAPKTEPKARKKDRKHA